MNQNYTAPSITELGSLHELTLADTPKVFSPVSDGFSFAGQPINTTPINVS